MENKKAADLFIEFGRKHGASIVQAGKPVIDNLEDALSLIHI